MRYSLTHNGNVDAPYAKGDKVKLLFHMRNDISLFTAGHVFEIVEIQPGTENTTYSLCDEDGFTLNHVIRDNIVPVTNNN